MEKDPKTTATWWTLEGFVLRPEPEAFSSMPDGDWGEVLAKAGYSSPVRCGDSIDDINIVVYDHASGKHSLVEFTSVDSVSAHFFCSRGIDVGLFCCLVFEGCSRCGDSSTK